MQVQSARVSAWQEAATSKTETARSGSSAKSVSAASSTIRSVRLPQFERFNSWSYVGAAQQKISETQSSEQALAMAYRQLKQLERQLSQSQQAGSQIRQQIADLDEQIAKQESSLTGDLTPKVLQNAQPKNSYVIDKVDLLSAKPSSEKLQLFFPSSSSAVSIDLPAGESGDALVSRLNQGLAKEQISVAVNGDGALTFSVAAGNSRKLDEAVFFSGEGIRVPAGNPVAIKLSPEKSELGKLSDGLSQGESQQEQQRLQKLLTNIEQSMRELKQYRRQMLAQLEKVKARTAEMSEEELNRLQQELQQQLSRGDFSQGFSALVTQANVSRQGVVALLGGS